MTIDSAIWPKAQDLVYKKFPNFYLYITYFILSPYILLLIFLFHHYSLFSISHYYFSSSTSFIFILVLPFRRIVCTYVLLVFLSLYICISFFRLSINIYFFSFLHFYVAISLWLPLYSFSFKYFGLFTVIIIQAKRNYLVKLIKILYYLYIVILLK